jgi:predicted oxidoreductase
LGGGFLASGGILRLPAEQQRHARQILGALDEIAGQRGVSRTVVALAWLLKHPSRMVPIIGSNNPERIRDAARAADVELTREEWYHLLIAARGEQLP